MTFRLARNVLINVLPILNAFLSVFGSLRYIVVSLKKKKILFQVKMSHFLLVYSMNRVELGDKSEK